MAGIIFVKLRSHKAFSIENVYISIRFGLASILKRSSFSSKTVESENGDFEYLQRENSWCTVCANGKPIEIASAFCGNWHYQSRAWNW